MYLEQLRKLNPSVGKWPGGEDTLIYNCAYDIVDATLNSWKEAHDVFSSRLALQPGYEDLPRTHVDHRTHMKMTDLVIKALRHCDDAQLVAWGTNKFPSEVLAYVLQVTWAENEDSDMKPCIGYTPIPAADCEREQEEAGGSKFRWDGQPQRCPKKGEWYMSGAIPEAYIAPNDLGTPYFIVVKAV